MARSEVLSVYIEDISPRASWVLRLIFEDLLGLKLSLTDDSTLLSIPGKTVLNYSVAEAPHLLSITPYGLLSETDLKPQDVRMSQYEGLPVFFPTGDGDLPFDPFSMIFYLVSRYEEYLPFKADGHGRFPHTESLAYKEGFLKLAIVNRLALKLKGLLLQKFPDLVCNCPDYRFIPTIDVDIAFAHLGKGFVRTYGAMAKLLLKGNIKEIGKRIRTMQGKAEDPYDNFDLLLSLFSKYSLDPVFFILAGNPGPFDRNLSLKNKLFAGLLIKLSESAELGVHPSYGAGHDHGKIKNEIDRIEAVTGKKVSKSRQHFVRMRFPETYEGLLHNGILEDYSMGYASMSGFRAGIASPFRFYNLRNDEETSLIVHPFIFMDTTLDDYMKLDPKDYPAAVVPLIEEVKAVNGTLIAIWHNYALADDVQKHKAFKDIMKTASRI